MTTSIPTGRRTPLSVVAAASLLALVSVAHGAGVVFFTVFVPEDPVGPLIGFTAVALVAALTVLAAIPGLVRGDATAWLVALCWSSALSYWSVYKIFAEREAEGVGFLAAELLILALLTARTTRAHVRRTP